MFSKESQVGQYGKKKRRRKLEEKSDQELMKTLDKEFSKYIRLRDADPNGYVRCCTCGKTAHWKEMDCGHFVPRDRRAVRYNEQNCHVQCPRCNRFRSGEAHTHGEYINRRHGPGTTDTLKALGKTLARHDRGFYLYWIPYYRHKVRMYS